MANTLKRPRSFRLSHVQVIALGFIGLILLGTVLLMLPFASADGQSASFREALFTATSASCVTGLVLRDTATSWSLFGQTVIIILIQIGGLGFMTVATFAYILLRKRMGLRNRETLVESISTSQVGGVMKLAGTIGLVTLAVEGLGAILLAIRFIPMYGIGQGIWYGVFHSISAFCNAGFDLMGIYEPFGSFMPFAGDWYVCTVLMLLITIGGLGFLVWDDILKCGFHVRRYRLHTKIVLVTSAILTFGGAALFFLYEGEATGAGLPIGERILTALFASVTARTAGFNTIDIASMSEGGRLLTLFLMLVGGSPGSTAGGAKTTTIAVVALYGFSGLIGRERPQVFKRTIPEKALYKSCSVLFFNLMLSIVAAVFLSRVDDIAMSETLFETFSAVGTVGMTAGITRDLSAVSAYVVAFLMYLGRVGSVSFGVALLKKRTPAPVTYPQEDITVG